MLYMQTFNKLILPFAVVLLGLAAPVVAGLYLSAWFDLPKGVVMVLIFLATSYLFLDLIRSFEKKK
jgi:ABC-type Mn2+/Zn2+ transport system permease subunit